MVPSTQGHPGPFNLPEHPPPRWQYGSAPAPRDLSARSSSQNYIGGWRSHACGIHSWLRLVLLTAMAPWSAGMRFCRFCVSVSDRSCAMPVPWALLLLRGRHSPASSCWRDAWEWKAPSPGLAGSAAGPDPGFLCTLLDTVPSDPSLAVLISSYCNVTTRLVP